MRVVKIGLAFVLFILIGISGSIHAQSSYKKAVLLFDDFIKKSNASWGFCLLDTNGKQLVSYQPNQLFIPASTLKIATTTPAWEILQSDFRFQTHIEYDGYIDECGILYGNFYIKGEGDPTLGSDRFSGYPSMDQILILIVKIIQKAGIKEINGKILIDHSFFNTGLQPPGWLITDIGNYYGSSADAFCIGENKYTIHLKSGKKIGDPVQFLYTDPIFIPKLTLVNQLTTGSASSGDQASVNIVSGDTVRYLQGTIPLGNTDFTIKGSLPDPAALFVYLLTKKVQLVDIKISNTIIPPFFKRNRLFTFSSPSLSEILIIVNQKSHNLFAEHILLMLGKKYKNEGSYEASIQTIVEYWKKKGVDLSSAVIVDGSGLSVENKISSFQLVRILHGIQSQKYFSSFIKTLSIIGETGTLKTWETKSLKGQLIGKSGNMKLMGERAYIGYLKKDDRFFSFALLINGYQGNTVVIKQRIEKLMEAIYNELK